MKRQRDITEKKAVYEAYMALKKKVDEVEFVCVSTKEGKEDEQEAGKDCGNS